VVPAAPAADEIGGERRRRWNDQPHALTAGLA
jgi:hypothetical protein